MLTESRIIPITEIIEHFNGAKPWHRFGVNLGLGYKKADEPEASQPSNITSDTKDVKEGKAYPDQHYIYLFRKSC